MAEKHNIILLVSLILRKIYQYLSLLIINVEANKIQDSDIAVLPITQNVEERLHISLEFTK